MAPVLVDLHIHTSDNPEDLNTSYDIQALKNGIEKIANGAQYLISLSDHNTINKNAYLKSVSIIRHILLGVELHVRNYKEADPYHCHIIFSSEISEKVIDSLNTKLDTLYPQKVVQKTNPNIPHLADIMNAFDDFEFLLLPHGGQNHATFDKSIPKNVKFDKTLERSIYYNHFDGFTARSNKGLEETQGYFKRLGINDFVHLVTATDNYNPSEYPACKAGKEAGGYTPTWMLAQPTFDGLRLSLSESSQLVYGPKPDVWLKCIQSVSLKNEHIDIDVDLTPGLNVVIGGSSSGKSLLVDSIYRKLSATFDGSVYLSPYEVHNINVDNPTGQRPHYIDQNYIARVCDPKDKENKIQHIPLLKNVFPSDEDEREQISQALASLEQELSILVHSVREINALDDELSRLYALSHLITSKPRVNPLKAVKPDEKVRIPMTLKKSKYQSYTNILDEIEAFLSKNPLITHDRTLVEKLKKELNLAFNRSSLEVSIFEIVCAEVLRVDQSHTDKERESTIKRKQFESLIDSVKKYIRAEKRFYKARNKISTFKVRIRTNEIVSMGHKLRIENRFELTREKFLMVVNQMLKSEHQLSSFDAITPSSLSESHFRKRNPVVAGYEDFERRVHGVFKGMNSREYKITTKDGKDFEQLSAGWKTSVVLDLILGWKEDNATLIIDQPEDNLATNYINHGLLSAIKECKSSKQLILVSHNATIPMLGDAQNIILCKNDNNKIVIRSNALEGRIHDNRVVDYVANITDGGKASVKKRVKKYNIKNFREDTT
ncbi:MAG: ATPase [Planctomycetes bacterium]|nr:ATPase [Planctomycetota bacterium]